MKVALLRLELRLESDVVLARKETRQIAAYLGFSPQEQTRLATAVSEIARNAFLYAELGKIEFAVTGDPPNMLWIRVSDRGPGIDHLDEILAERHVSKTGMGLGILGARRLSDQFQIESTPGVGTTVSMGKLLPKVAQVWSGQALRQVLDALARREPESLLEEIQQQNQQLLSALEELRLRQAEIERLNQELAITNRSILTLNAELAARAEALTVSQSTLQDQTRIFQSILDSMGDGVAVADTAGRFLVFNPAAAQILGMNQQDIQPEAWASVYGLFLPDQITPYPTEQLPLFQAIQGHPVDGAEIFVQHPNLPEGVWISVNARPLRDERGTLWGGIMVFRDITERKQAEAERLQLLSWEQSARTQAEANEQRFRFLAETIPQQVWTARPDGVLDYANQRTLIYCGLTQTDVTQGDWVLAIHPEDVPRTLERWQRSIETGELYEIEFRICRAADSAYRWHIVRALPLRDQQGQIISWFGTNTDIDDQKRNEQELRENADMLRALYEVTAAADLSFDQHLQTLIAMGCEWFGLDVGIVARVEGNRYEIIAAQTPTGILAKGDVLDLQRTYCSETVHRSAPLMIQQASTSEWQHHPGFKNFQIETHMGMRIVVAGQVYGVLCFGSQTLRRTPFKAVEQELLKLMSQWVGSEIERRQAATNLAQAHDQALAASRAKSEFLANMSHEIRTPMNAIIGLTDLLLNTPLSAQQQDFAETIRSSSDVLLTVINDILDFSKIESGKLELEHHSFELCTCVEEALDLLAASAAEKGIELAYLIDPQVPAYLRGDSTRLRQILLNLLSNAVKFTEVGEVVVSVTAQAIEPDLRGIPSLELDSSSALPTYEIQFAVKDTGIGIPVSRRDRLFQAFSQVDSSTTRQYGGTGLGLAISKRLSELMGGKLWVESQVGLGSTFYFTVLVMADPQATTTAGRDRKPQLAGKRVLIVDDNATNRQILSLQAASWHMQSRVAQSGAEALTWLNQGEAFDVAILDLQMPEMDGLTLAAEIRKLADTQPLPPDQPALPLPLIMLTSIDKPPQNAMGEPIDFAAFLTKPIKQSQLYNVLLQAVNTQPLPQSTSPGASTSTLITHSQLAQQVPLKILLAEDNEVNQKVALHLLAQMGYRADVVVNGYEVLSSLQHQTYDVILMDVQMPEMDGLTATRYICDNWPREQRPRIIAMTANAMQGDREACLAAGMDGYLSKPIRVAGLAQVLSQCQTQPEPPPLPPSPMSAVVPDPVTILDLAALQSLREMAGERAAEMIPQWIGCYLEDAPQLVQTIMDAIARADAKSLQQAAHTLKSSSATLGAMTLAGLCKELELLGRNGTTDTAADKLLQLQAEYEQVKIALSQECQKQPS